MTARLSFSAKACSGVGRSSGRSIGEVGLASSLLVSKSGGVGPPPQHHQRFIDCYARHPSCECRIPAKSIEVQNCMLKGMLYGTFRTLVMWSQPNGGTEDLH